MSDRHPDVPVLLPCPFCGAGEARVGWYAIAYGGPRACEAAAGCGGGEWIPLCDACGAEGPSAPTPAEAARLWNTRAQQPPDLERARLEREVMEAACEMERAQAEYEAAPCHDLRVNAEEAYRQAREAARALLAACAEKEATG